MLRAGCKFAERVRTDIIAQSQFDVRMRVRPDPAEVERAAKLLLSAKMPLMIVGDEVYRAKASAKAAKLAELLGMPVTQARQLFTNFAESHPLWVGSLPGGTLTGPRVVHRLPGLAVSGRALC